MCKLGDIIVVNKFTDKNGDVIPKHSFVVINDTANYIESLRYDFVSNILCSFHNDVKRKKKLNLESNLLIDKNAIQGKNLNNKNGYIRADELFYFDKNKIQYKVIAHVKDDFLNKLIKLNIKLHKKNKSINVVTNL